MTDQEIRDKAFEALVEIAAQGAPHDRILAADILLRHTYLEVS